MKIICAGGGSGGHVTPVAAVINELKKWDETLQVWFVCDKGFVEQSRLIMRRCEVEVDVKTIAAGKIRRYHGIAWWRQVLDFNTTFLNVRDFFKIGFGFAQSAWLLLRVRPDAIFTKGGFVCVPVGLAAALFRVPLVIHDSDAHPGLTNRLLARFAVAIGTGAPLENYPYPSAISRYVGIPVSEAMRPGDASEQAELKRLLGYEPEVPLLLVTGGGLGAARINEAMVACARQLSERCQVVHLTGSKHVEAIRRQVETVSRRYHALPFVSGDMPALIRSADVVVTRAGATSLMEFAAAAKPTIIVPNPRLTSGHQLKNAAVYEKACAAIVIDETKLASRSEMILEAVVDLLNDSQKRSRLSHAILKLARPEAAAEMAGMIVAAALAGKAGEG